MKSVKSIIVALLLPAGLSATAVRADSPAAIEAGQRPVVLASFADPAPAEREVQIVAFGMQSAVWNTNRSRTIEATVNFQFKDGTPRSVVVTVGPGQKVPYKTQAEGANSRIVGARYVN